VITAKRTKLKPNRLLCLDNWMTRVFNASAHVGLLAYDGQQRVLRGLSRAVAGDPYQLRIYLPDGFAAKRVELSGGLTPKMETDGSLLTVDYTSSRGKDVEWKVLF